jgi:hypothetical protein
MLFDVSLSHGVISNLTGVGFAERFLSHTGLFYQWRLGDLYPFPCKYVYSPPTSTVPDEWAYNYFRVEFERNIRAYESNFTNEVYCNVDFRFIDFNNCVRQRATRWEVAGSILNGVIGICEWLNPSGRTMALESTQSLTEMSTMNVS